MLNIQNLTYLQGGIPLFQQVDLQAYSNQRIGLVGKNGYSHRVGWTVNRPNLLSE